jgi:rhodanese-related sulfurtransferase
MTRLEPPTLVGYIRALMQHSPNFLRIVDEARPRVREITIEQARKRLAENPRCVLLDVREDHEWEAGHAIGAVHLGRGILERDIEKLYPDFDTEILMYCRGGYRSVLACDSARKIGYRNVASIIGGYRGMIASGWPVTGPSGQST